MLDMANKKHKYQYAKITRGGAIPVTDISEQTGTRGFRDVGIYVIGKAKEEDTEEGDYRELRVATKTDAKLVRRDSDKKENLPLVKVGGVDFVAESYSKNVSRVLSYLAYLVQYKPPHKKGEWHIKNIAEASRFLEMQPHRFKECISFLASRNLPYITTRGGHFYYKGYRRLVEIRVKMRTQDTMAKGEGFITQKQEEILDRKSVIDTIIINPTREFMNGLGFDTNGKLLSKEEFRKLGGLGNILLPVQSLKDSKDESLMEFRLRRFFVGNTPKQRYKLDTLLAEVGITAEDIKQQGKPRYKKQIELELNKLRSRGLITYTYSNKTKVYYFTVTDKAFKHPQLHKRGGKSIAVNTESR